MTSTLTDDDFREMAQARVDFKRHVASYALFNVLFVAIWYFTGQGYYWPIWPMLGWGIGIASHAWGVYGQPSNAVKREEERLRQKHGRA